MIIKTFWIEPLPLVALYLRRFCWSTNGKCQGKYGYHNAKIYLKDVEAPLDRDRGPYQWPREDPLWPRACECGYVFSDADQWQVFDDRVYRRMDNGDDFPLRLAPPGSLYVADWYDYDAHSFMHGYDKLSVHCVKPHGDTWCIDQRASNCTMPDDDKHRCWVRHGTFGETVHVDKAGLTCAAGAGSIFSGRNREWHGFLDHGYLTPTRGVYR